MYDFDTVDTWIQHRITNLSQGLSILNDYKTIICLLLQEFYCWQVVTAEVILTQYGSEQTAHHPFEHHFFSLPKTYLFSEENIAFCDIQLAKNISIY